MAGDFLELIDAPSGAASSVAAKPWKIAIIDDDEAVHEGTSFALKHFEFEHRPMALIGARSAADGYALLADHPDTAVVLLDVVMENDSAGLDLARKIRSDLGNEFVRIILRTGHPGEVPEHRIVLDYDINDYKAKTELTAEKLYISITAALRSFEQLKRLDETRHGLELIVDGADALFDDRSLRTLAHGILIQLNTLLAIDCSGILVLREAANGSHSVLASTGSFADRLAELDFEGLFTKAGSIRHPLHVDTLTQLFVRTGGGAEILVLLDSAAALTQTQIDLVSVFSSKLAIAIDNARLYDELRIANADLEDRVAERTADLAAANERLDAQAGLLRRVNAFKNEILGTVAHDLKNPLAVILGRGEMLSSIAKTIPEPKATMILTQVENIRTAAQRMIRIVDVSMADALADALDITLDRRRTDLAAIIRNAASLAATLCEEKDQRLDTSLPQRLAVICDPDRMAEAVENLLSNAVKYAPVGGRILVTLAASEFEAVIRVDDTGPGLTQEDAMRVFGRFQRLSAQPTAGEASTGLGLSIVRRIVELHGGSVGVVENGELGGASFSITLPLVPERTRR
ncbi:DUF3369 domain-containing protein [Fulvimarina sp. 2208YS6-2-32]|uniref:histidine kinase n=1 Tax=Fulvimarina uroteuthidis TaxID=3098149 RepID=A0ABU5I5Y9_9HYPH|nr:DUF3369 domain-containing protein [Fulvimarina sp. 2208YS6-2-32]MDY8110168.1 DUF3369 domain-containing protein [Fulvimarina sp. 2208YS6-2-32]